MVKAKFIITATVCTMLSPAMAQSVADFYTETWENGVTRNVVEDYNADGTDALDDSAAFQRAIDELTQKKNGGKLMVPTGTYYLYKVALKSNVHLAFEKDVVLRPLPRGGFLFTAGMGNDTVENVSFRGIDGKVTADFREMSPDTKVTVINLQNVDNFLIRNMRTLDNFTVHSSIRMNVADTDQGARFARNGFVSDIDNTNAHVGYGTIQVNAGKNILFQNISGSGGVQLRLESGANFKGEIEGSIFDIVGRNISGSNGNAVVMISPHCRKNGLVDIDGVTSHSSVHAVRVDIGDTKNGPTPGYFDSNSRVSNVKAFYGTTAQLKHGHFRWIPPELKSQISRQKNPDGSSYSGPAAAAIKYTCGGTGPGTFKVKLENIEQIGFEYQPKKILTPADEFRKGR
ncbi:glycosyl hydrolase family 28-related protein [Pontiella agarivorans]|uniref:Glycosyl hydrolase family 28-related protein n=1 Tax=Pontiella agarivorans TaxID=3038953 RepID=A0ABU5MS85_9BACT|nr:glycosyl hydrolase family 28-related protein [Pontiella agarivorans]MDZ8117069.1 glycosyl hydrolase family 28-related protein [Pontiella agarivorans]